MNGLWLSLLLATPLQASAPGANPDSPRIPESFIEEARARELVAVGGADGGTHFRNMIGQGMGTEALPFGDIQSIEAAAAILELAEPSRDLLYAWGFGVAPDPEATYTYRASSGKLYRLRFLNRDAVGPAYGGLTGYSRYKEGHARADARNLQAALDESPVLDGRPAMVVGHSWAAVVVTFGLTHAGLLRVPGVALAAPKHIVTGPDFPGPLARNKEDGKDFWSLLLPLAKDGDYGELYLVRRPDDQVAADGLAPLFARFQGPTHDYRLSWHHGADGARLPGGFWGVSGEGLLLSATPGY